MRGFLLDTMVPSELIRPRPDPRVTLWLDDTDDLQLYFSVISIGEICKGFTTHPDERRRIRLRRWLENTLRPWLAGRILPVTESICERWGVLDGECQLRGTPIAVPDGLLAATAIEYDLTLVTRNVKDFVSLDVDIFNPWTG